MFVNKIGNNVLFPFASQVTQVFAVPVADLLNSENQGYTTYRNGWRMPVFLSDVRHIWGLTAIMTEHVLAAAFPEHYKLQVAFKK